MFFQDDLSRYWLSPYLLAIEEGSEDPGAGGGGEAEPEVDLTGEPQEPQQAATTEPQAPAEPEPPKKPAWYMERIDKLTGQKGELERRAQVLEQQVRALRSTLETYFDPARVGATAAPSGQNPDPTSTTTSTTPDHGVRTYTREEMLAEAQRLAQEEAQKAQQTAAENAFNARCNEVAMAARARHGAEFDAGLANLQAAGVMDRPFLESVTALDDAAGVLNHLGKNPEEALRIRSLSPYQMAIALAKLEGQLGAAPVARAPSGMPAPVTRINGGSTPGEASLDDPNLPYGEWLKLREKNLQTRH